MRQAQPSRFIIKHASRTINTRTPHPISRHEIPTLDHEPLDDTMEPAALVAHGLAVGGAFSLARAQVPEVFGRQRHAVCVQLVFYPP